MRQGAGVLLLAIACSSIAVPALAGSSARYGPGPGATASISTDRSGSRASASQTPVSLAVNAKPGFANKFNVFVDPGPPAELVIRSPQGLARPGGQCTPPPPDDPVNPTTEVRCPVGYIDVIFGNLGDRDDIFSAAPNVKVLLGGVSEGQTRRLYGGTGGDRLVGGGAGDGLAGDAGSDTVLGGPGRDALYGGKGRDRLVGGGAIDLLFAGAGADKLNGGKGRNICNGGGGRDTAKRCPLIRKIP